MSATLNFFVEPLCLDVQIETKQKPELETAGERFMRIYAVKRAAAIKYLGHRYILHPQYKSANHPQHNVVLAA